MMARIQSKVNLEDFLLHVSAFMRTIIHLVANLVCCS